MPSVCLRYSKAEAVAVVFKMGKSSTVQNYVAALFYSKKKKKNAESDICHMVCYVKKPNVYVEATYVWCNTFPERSCIKEEVRKNLCSGGCCVLRSQKGCS